MIDYIALLSEDENRVYHVMFPDFPGCMTAGSTIAGAKRMAREVLMNHLSIMKADGAIIPSPSSCAEIMTNRAYREALAFEVAVSALYCGIRLQ